MARVCREFAELLNGVYISTGDYNGVNFYRKNESSAAPLGVFLSKELTDFGQNPEFGAWYLHLNAPDVRFSEDAIAFALDNSDDAG